MTGASRPPALGKKGKVGFFFRPQITLRLRLPTSIPSLTRRPFALRHSTSMVAAAAPASSSLADANVATVAGLRPQPLWRYFAQLSALPRPSKQEER